MIQSFIAGSHDVVPMCKNLIAKGVTVVPFTMQTLKELCCSERIISELLLP